MDENKSRKEEEQEKLDRTMKRKRCFSIEKGFTSSSKGILSYVQIGRTIPPGQETAKGEPSIPHCTVMKGMSPFSGFKSTIVVPGTEPRSQELKFSLVLLSLVVQ